MANNQLLSGTFGTTECLQWWAFTPVTRHPLQDFGPKMGEGVGGAFAPRWAYTPNFSVYILLIYCKSRNFQCVKISVLGEISLPVARNLWYKLLFVNALCT